MTEKNYVVNVKTKIGTIVTVRSDTAEELQSNIEAFINFSLNDHIGALEELFHGIQPVAVAPAQAIVAGTLGGTVISETPNEPASFAPVPPPSTNAPVATGARMCNHGPMIGRKGNGAKGEWKGLFCPTPKGTVGQCDPVWLNRSMPEWASV